MVSQEPTLFACSIKDNIAYGRDATMEEVSTKKFIKRVWNTVTVNLGIFSRVLFSRNFADVKFLENKIFAK